MKTLRISALVLSLSICIVGSAQAAGPDCADVEEAVLGAGPSELMQILSMTKPLRVKSSKGSGELTYSHDTEIPAADWIALIYRSSRATTALDKYIGTFSAAEVTKLTGMKKSQFEDMLREDASGEAPYRASDFEPLYATALIGSKLGKDGFHVIVQKIVDSALKDTTKEPVHATWDGLAIELVHNNFAKTPAEAKKSVEWLFSTFQEPNAHLHMGLPTAAIPHAKAIDIARALEVDIVLERASRAYAQLGELSYVEGSPLRQDFTRGIIFLKNGEYGDGFVTPTQAHDLEIRQYASRDAGLHLLALGSKLAMNSDRIFKAKQQKYGDTGTENYDLKVGNISGALEYAAELTGRSRKADVKALSDELTSLAKDFANPKKVTAAKREKLRKFILENNLLQIVGDWRLYGQGLR